MEDSNPTMTPREHWQRAVSKVAAERIVDDGIQDPRSRAWSSSAHSSKW
jgi:hypothetical protein